jgi:hypothetical protein
VIRNESLSTSSIRQTFDLREGVSLRISKGINKPSMMAGNDELEPSEAIGEIMGEMESRL